MKPTHRLKLIAEVRDLQIIDCNGCKCGIVDDIELEGRPGGPLSLQAILVGPGAYSGRLPHWLFWAVRFVAGKRMVRVPWSEVENIASTLQLRSPAQTLGLMRSENKARRYLPRGGAI
jgi:sporulation protein YlmC with PRC-barrel domain